MSDILTPQKNVTLSVDNDNCHALIAEFGRAVSVPERLAVLKCILLASKSVPDIAAELNLPASSVARHIDILDKAGLIYTSLQPGPKGHAKYCSQAVLSVTLSLEADDSRKEDAGYKVEMPLGMFSHCTSKRRAV